MTSAFYKSSRNIIPSTAVFFFLFAAVILAWTPLRHEKAKWLNVPPVPNERNAVSFGVGDAQFSFRSYSIMLQNMGDSGGDVTPLLDYDYDKLGEWFFLLSKLDHRSNYIPFMAAYYFGATTNPDQLDPVIDYLEFVGSDETGERWRWLAQAAFLARFDQKDISKAMRLAHKLAAMNVDNMPVWAAQMPVFIMVEQGDTEAALQMMLGYLQTEQDNMHPNEINFVVHMICERLMTPDRAANLELCAGLSSNNE